MRKCTTTIAMVIATIGLLCNTGGAQLATPYPVMPASCTTCDAGAAGNCDGTCDSSCGGSCGAVGKASLFPNIGRLGLGHRPYRAWATAEALLWWGKGRSAPPLVTTSPQGTPRADAGVLGRTDTAILFGDGAVGNQIAAGVRGDFGIWIDQCENLGIGTRVWGIFGDQSSFSASSPASDPILARPFYNAVLAQQDALLVSFPGLTTGDISVTSDSSVLGVEAYLRSSMLAGCGYNVDLIGGYHFVQLNDELSITNRSVSTDPGGFVPVGTVFNVADHFDTTNDFHGGEIGVTGEARHGCWTLTGLVKLSVGNMRQRVRIDGNSAVTTPNSTPLVTAGGMLALPTNMGQYTRDKVGIIPEVGITLSYRVRQWLNLSVGYSAIYWSDVLLAADQIDMNVNPTQFNGGLLIGPSVPTFVYKNTEYWMHGLTLGGTISF